MMKAIEQIVAGYVFLNDRAALEEIREHRKRLLNENRMRSSIINPQSLETALQEEIAVVEAAIEKLESDTAHQSYKP